MAVNQEIIRTIVVELKSRGFDQQAELLQKVADAGGDVDATIASINKNLDLTPAKQTSVKKGFESWERSVQPAIGALDRLGKGLASAILMKRQFGDDPTVGPRVASAVEAGVESYKGYLNAQKQIADGFIEDQERMLEAAKAEFAEINALLKQRDALLQKSDPLAYAKQQHSQNLTTYDRMQSLGIVTPQQKAGFVAYSQSNVDKVDPKVQEANDVVAAMTRLREDAARERQDHLADLQKEAQKTLNQVDPHGQALQAFSQRKQVLDELLSEKMIGPEHHAAAMGAAQQNVDRTNPVLIKQQELVEALAKTWDTYLKSEEARLETLKARAESVLDKVDPLGQAQKRQQQANAEADELLKAKLISPEAHQAAYAYNQQKVDTVAQNLDPSYQLQQTVQKSEGDALARRTRLINEMLQKAAPLSEEVKRLDAAQKSYDIALKNGEITQKEYNELISYSAQRMDVLKRALGQDGVAGTLRLSQNQWHIFYQQLQDVGTMFAMGMPFEQILTSQGAQVYDVLASARGGLSGGLEAVKERLLDLVKPARVVMGGLAVGAITAAAAVSRYQSSVRELQQSLVGRGRQTGATTGDLNEIAEAGAGPAGMSAHQARSAVADFTSFGRIGTGIYADLLKATKDYAAVTKEDLPSATKELAAALADPVRGAQELDAKFNLFNSTQLETIQRMAATGDRLGAQKAILASLESVIQGANEKTGLWAKTWDGLGNIISSVFDKLGKALSGPSVGDRLENEIKALQNAIEQAEKLRQMHETNPEAYAGAIRAGIAAPPSVLPQAPGAADSARQSRLSSDLIENTELLDRVATAKDMADANDFSKQFKEMSDALDPLNAEVEKLHNNLTALQNARNKGSFRFLPQQVKDQYDTVLKEQKAATDEGDLAKQKGGRSLLDEWRGADFQASIAGMEDFQKQLRQIEHDAEMTRKKPENQNDAAKAAIGTIEELQKQAAQDAAEKSAQLTLRNSTFNAQTAGMEQYAQQVAAINHQYDEQILVLKEAGKATETLEAARKKDLAALQERTTKGANDNLRQNQFAAQTADMRQYAKQVADINHEIDEANRHVAGDADAVAANEQSRYYKLIALLKETKKAAKDAADEAAFSRSIVGLSSYEQQLARLKHEYDVSAREAGENIGVVAEAKRKRDDQAGELDASTYKGLAGQFAPDAMGLKDLQDYQDALDKTAKAAKEAGVPAEALAEIQERLRVRTDAYRTGLEKMKEDQDLELKQINALTLGERIAADTEKALTEARRQGATAAEQAAIKEGLRNKAIAEANKQADDALRSARDQALTLGMKPYQRALTQNQIERANSLQQVDPNAPRAYPVLPGDRARVDDTTLRQIVQATQRMSSQTGFDAKSLLAIMGFETGGTFNPRMPGQITKWGRMQGLIQMGGPQAAAAGVTDFGNVEQQVQAIGRYLIQHGAKPGDDIYRLYAAINTGNPNTGYKSDTRNGGTPGSANDKVTYQMPGFVAMADALLKKHGAQAAAESEDKDFSILGEHTGPKVHSNAKETVDATTALKDLGVAYEFLQKPIDDANEALDAQMAALKMQQGVLGGTTRDIANMNEQIQLYAQFAANGVHITPELRAQIEALGKKAGDTAVVEERLNATRDAIQGIKDTGQDAMKGFISDLMHGTSAADALKNALSKVGDKLLDIAMNSLFKSSPGGGGGGLGDVLTGLTRSLFGGTPAAANFDPITGSVIGLVHHAGGMVGVDGTPRMVDASVFANAHRYHDGGALGLKPGEVPIIGQTGEWMWSRDDVAAFKRGAANGNSGGPGVVVNNYGPTPASVNQRTDGSYEVYIDSIENHIAGKIARGKGPILKASSGRAGGQSLKG